VSTLNEEIKYSYATCGNVVPEEVEEENIEEEDGEGEVEAADEEQAGPEDVKGAEEANDAVEEAGAEEANDADEEAGPEDSKGTEEADDAAEEVDPEFMEGSEDAEEGFVADEVPLPEELGVCECLKTHDQDVFFPMDSAPHIVFTYEGVDYMYPPNYGLAVCSDWDADLDPFCTENGPDFCGAEWCFVSPDCEASDTTSANLNAEISYSYATCGFSADFPDEGEEAESEQVEEAEEPEAAGEDETGVCECVEFHGEPVFFSDQFTAYIVATIEGESYQYPAMYGAGTCGAWDMDLEPSCAMNEKDYCERSWCYVDEDCMASDLTESDIFEGLQFSYRTCGSISIEKTVEEHIPTLFDEFIQGIKDAAAADDEEDEATADEDEETVTEEPVAVEEDEEPVAEEPVSDEEEADEEETTEEPAQDDEQVDETGICECLETHGQAVTFPEDGEPFITYTIDGVDFEYPANYGSGACAAWDSGLEPDCADTNEGSCAAMWCYVSPDCEASDVAVSSLNDEISYSYATCGDMVESAVEDEEPVADEGEEVADEEDEEVPFPEELGVCECLQ